MSAWLLSACVVMAMTLTAEVAGQCNCPIVEDDLCFRCECVQTPDQRMVINCKDKGLTQVPTFESSPIDYEEVTLAGNQIQAIPAQKFQALSSLKKLDLTGNSIQSVDTKAFSGLSALDELLLEVNGMTTFPTAAFTDLTSLGTLYAQGFQLTSLPPNALSSNTQLHTLSLVYSGLQSLPETALSGQEASLRELRLDHNALSSVPTAAVSRLQNLQYLSLVANAISDLGANSFQGSAGLRQLDLSENGLDSVHQDTFDGLSNLETLTLRSCQLSDLMLPAIQGLASLTELELSQNTFLANIPNNFFSGWSRLTDLNLHNCAVGTLRTATLNGLTNLLRLDLGSNSLVTVDTDVFTSTPKLQTLDLNANPGLAARLSESVFQPISNTLAVLSVESTGFSDAHWSMLAGLSALRTLALSDNQLTVLPDMSLADKPLLTSLSLDGNDIRVLRQESLTGPNDNLVSANFAGNRINTIPECTFHQFTTFDFFQLNLNTNPLHCDCGLRWLLQTLQGHPDYDFLQFSLSWTCATPPLHAGKNFAQDLSPSDLTCAPAVTFPPCLDLAPSTPAATSPTPEGSTSDPYVFTLNITTVSDTSISLAWEVGNTDGLSGFSVEHLQLPSGEKQYQQYGVTTRNATISDLEASADYIVCVVALGVVWPTSTSLCESVRTAPPAGESTPPKDATMSIVLGCCLGVLVIIVVIVVVVLVTRKRARNKKRDNDGYFTNAMGVRVGGESKRFSKPQQNKVRDTAYFQNRDNVDFEHKLEGFTREERDRILGLVSQSGASTLSMISNVSSQRYRDLPAPPGGQEGYLNAGLEGDELDKHVYCEIPGEGNYQEIPDSFI